MKAEPKVTRCRYPKCEAPATGTIVFKADNPGEEALGHVPLCDSHCRYCMQPENEFEIRDLFGPMTIVMIDIVTRQAKENWDEEI